MKVSMILSLRKKFITLCFIAAMWRVNMFLRIFSIRRNRRVLQKRSESAVMAIVELAKQEYIHHYFLNKEIRV